MINAALQSEIENNIRDRIVSITPLSAANNAQIYRLHLASHRMVVAKSAQYGLDTEAFMLNYLREKSSLPVPAVYFGNEHVIVMEYINAVATQESQAHRHAAALLADLHDVTAEKYGFDRPTAIGSLLQPNTQTDDWAAFFINHRLLYMAEAALKENRVDAKFMKNVEKLAAKLPDMLAGANPPSLIHGDVWSGNVLIGRGTIAAFLDPAIYYADAEMELAFIRLFNTFGDGFFNAYQERRPIRAGFFEERADIYNIYPLLVHGRLFGPSYIRKAQKLIDRFV